MEFIKNVINYILPRKTEPEFGKPEGYKNVNSSAVNKSTQ